jgi:hypothetical protein
MVGKGQAEPAPPRVFRACLTDGSGLRQHVLLVGSAPAPGGLGQAPPAGTIGPQGAADECPRPYTPRPSHPIQLLDDPMMGNRFADHVGCLAGRLLGTKRS